MPLKCFADTGATIMSGKFLHREIRRGRNTFDTFRSLRYQACSQRKANRIPPRAFKFGGHVRPLVTGSRGTDLRILAISWPDRAAALLALRESGLTRPEDMRGRYESIDWRRAFVLVGYHAALLKAGLKPSDVEFVEIDIERSYL